MNKKDDKKTFEFIPESYDYAKERINLANKFIEEGLTFKHAWWKAFQQFPRCPIQVTEPSPEPSVDHKKTC